MNLSEEDHWLLNVHYYTSASHSIYNETEVAIDILFRIMTSVGSNALQVTRVT